MQVPDSVANTKNEFLNFSLYLRPAVAVKANRETQTSLKDEKEKTKHVLPGSNGAASAQMELMSLTDKSSEALIPGEHSRKKRNIWHHISGNASAIAAAGTKENSPNAESTQRLASSVCSRKVSNSPTYQLKTKRQGIDKYTSDGENFEDNLGVAIKRASKSGKKRLRTAEMHNLSEKKRRDKINRKMIALQELIPNCDKMDKIAILDEAIGYLKTLKLQHQIMTALFGGLYMPQLMLSSTMQQISASPMAPFSPMGIGMDMRMPIRTGGSHALSGTAFQLPGLPSHVIFPMHTSNLPFAPTTPTGGSFPQSLVKNPCRTADVMTIPTSAPTLYSSGSLEGPNKEHKTEFSGSLISWSGSGSSSSSSSG